MLVSFSGRQVLSKFVHFNLPSDPFTFNDFSLIPLLPRLLSLLHLFVHSVQLLHDGSIPWQSLQGLQYLCFVFDSCFLWLIFLNTEILQIGVCPVISFIPFLRQEGKDVVMCSLAHIRNLTVFLVQILEEL